MKPSAFLPAFAVSLSCGAAPTIPQRHPHPAEMGPAMRRHFGPASAIQSSLVTGDLPRAKRAAESLLARLKQEDQPVGWGPALFEVHEAAQAVISSETVELAAMATARLGLACGKCHDNLGVPFDDVALPLITTPPADLDQAMHRHLSAADDMWMSLLTASNERWLSGSQNLAHSNLFPIEQGVTSDEMRAIATRFHALAGVAQNTQWPAERAQIYGEILGTCAHCHAASGLQGSKP